LDSRIRWKCRRGLLELDLILSNFLKEKIHTLDNKCLSEFNNLLDYPDPQLLEILLNKEKFSHLKLKVLDYF